MNQVVHFGAGALGRGLVVPMLYESGMDVVLVDTNPRLIDFLRKNCVYQIDETDTAQRMKTIEVKDVIHSIDEKEKLTKVLNRNFLSLGITLLFHIHKGIIGCRQALDFLAFRYFL